MTDSAEIIEWWKRIERFTTDPRVRLERELRWRDEREQMKRRLQRRDEKKRARERMMRI